jgi:hypothetical protein
MSKVPLSQLDNAVIVTMDRELLELSVKSERYNRISFIIPECKRLGITNEYVNTISGKRLSNDYILYRQKPLIDKHNEPKPI